MTAQSHDIDPKVYARRWATLGVLSLGLLIIGLDNTILNVALPSLQDQLGAEGSALQWIVDSYLLVFAGLVLSMGAVGDRFGRKRILQAGTAIFGLASLCVVFVSTSGQLIGVRALMGVGAAMIMPATLSIISNVFPREERAKAIAVWTATAAVGIGLGPLAGGLLLEWFDWQAIFLVNVPVAAIAFLLGLRFVPESRDPHPGSFDLVGAALSVVALVTFVYGIIEAPGRGWLDPVTLGCFGAAALVAVAFVVWELRTREPMLDLSYFKEPRFGVASVAISLAFFSLFGAAFATTLYLQFAHGYSALQAGAAMSPLALGLIVGAGSGAKLSARLGTTRVVAAGLAGLGLLQLATLAWTPDIAYWSLGLWFFALALSIGWIMGPATDSVMGAVSDEKAGVASAMNDVTRQVAGALGVAVVGSLVASFYTSRVEDATTALPPESAQAASDSVGGAVAVAEQIPGEAGTSLAHSATVAYTDALGMGLLAGAAASFVGVALVLRFLPAQHRPAEVVAPVPVPVVQRLAA
jgi:MFS transporter, DHA2 family, multidrug resistance protein